jgi:hypothetical protein
MIFVLKDSILIFKSFDLVRIEGLSLFDLIFQKSYLFLKQVGSFDDRPTVILILRPSKQALIFLHVISPKNIVFFL